MRLPRGQSSHACSSRVSALSSRIARSRYFSRISSSVAGIGAAGFDGPRERSLALHHALRVARRTRRSLRARLAAPAGVAFVSRNFSACT